MNAAGILATGAVEDAVDVVVLDDDKLTLEIVSWILKPTAISYKLFSDYYLAQSYLFESVPKLLIVDFYMPLGNGVDFLRELQSQSDLSHTTIYLCSAITPKLADEQTILSLGASLLEKQVICDKIKFLNILESI